METPFDSLIFGLQQSMYISQQRKVPLSEVFTVVFSFSKIARVLYNNMSDASEKLQVFLDTVMNQRFPSTPSLEETHEREDGTIRCRLSYVQFIEHINRTGRVLKQKGFPLPLYGRVYFFRNKMVEHWDDYLQFIAEAEAISFSRGKIAIPYAFAGIMRDKDRTNLQQELTDEFAKWGVTLPSLVGKWQAVYSDLMYASLEEIDPELRSYHEKKKIGIPEPLVTLLFKYSFPTPICDMEEYCKTLAAWLETIPLQ